MEKQFSKFVKAFADGHTILARADNLSDWRKAKSPHDIVDAYEVKYASVLLKTRRFAWNCHGKPVVGIITPEEQERDPREKWGKFLEWLDNDWRTHDVRLPKGAPHMHAEVMKAWADGAKLRWKPNGGLYWTYEGEGFVPQFGDRYTYEVAPEVVRYRRALLQFGVAAPPTVMSFNETQQAGPAAWQRSMERMGYTVHWLDTDWQTAEVPQGGKK